MDESYYFQSNVMLVHMSMIMFKSTDIILLFSTDVIGEKALDDYNYHTM